MSKIIAICSAVGLWAGLSIPSEAFAAAQTCCESLRPDSTKQVSIQTEKIGELRPVSQALLNGDGTPLDYFIPPTSAEIDSTLSRLGFAFLSWRKPQIRAQVLHSGLSPPLQNG